MRRSRFALGLFLILLILLNDSAARQSGVALERVLSMFSLQEVGKIDAPRTTWQTVYRLRLPGQ